MSENILLLSTEVIKDRTTMHGNIDPKLIWPELKAAQDMYILPILGSALFNKLLTLINNNTITDVGNADYKALLDNYIIDAMMNYALSTLPITLSYQFWNKGVVRKQGDSTEMPSMSELMDLCNHYKNRAEHYAERLKYYLMQNAPTKFREYLNPGSTIDTVIPDINQFTSPIPLDDDRHNPYCNKGGFNGQPYHD